MCTRSWLEVCFILSLIILAERGCSVNDLICTHTVVPEGLLGKTVDSRSSKYHGGWPIVKCQRGVGFKLNYKRSVPTAASAHIPISIIHHKITV